MNSRYLNVFLKIDLCLGVFSLSGPLIRDVSLDGRFGDGTDAADVVAPRPQTRQIRLKPRKLFPKLVAGESLELCRQPCWCHSWVAHNEHVNVVGQDFQSVNLRFNFFRSLVQKFSQSLRKRLHQDAFAVFRAPHQVIVERENRPSVDAVAIINHELTISSC